MLSAAVLVWTIVHGRHTAVDPLAGKKRIVVLPFENLTRDRKDDWLAGAFSDSLTIGLQDLDDVICISRDRIVANTGWPVRFAATLIETPKPTANELAVLRDLHARTARAHGTA